MGPTEDDLTFDEEVADDEVVVVPAGTWHNNANIDDAAIKVHALYGPPDHVPSTVHDTNADARKDPNEH